MAQGKKAGEIRAFYEHCSETLGKYWEEVQACEVEHDYMPEMRQDIASTMRASEKSYSYVLPTQVLAKLTDETLDSRCIQDTREGGQGNFNARDVCKYVIVPWERLQGIPLGESSDPYVNNPLRYPEISPRFRENRRQRETWDKLCEILSAIEVQSERTFTENVFKQILLETRRLQEEAQIRYIIPNRFNLRTTMTTLNDFLSVSSGGARLQTVLVALFRTMKTHWGIYDEVFSAPVNVSDASKGRPSDIDCRKNGRTILAVEVKDTMLTLSLLEDKIRSCRSNDVDELMFLIRANPLTQDTIPQRIEKEFANGLNIYTLDALAFLESNLACLGEKSRRDFIAEVGRVGEELRLKFADRKHWERILTSL